MLAAQSDPAEELEEVWKQICREGLTRVVPQFVVAMDSGFLYCGYRKWPCPRYPGNYTEPDHVHAETGINAGLGLAWVLAQHQARLAAMRRQNIRTVSRFAGLLDEAMLRVSVPPTYSCRFETMFQMQPIAGVMEWGRHARWAHNRLQLRSFGRKKDDAKRWWDRELLQADVDPSTLDEQSAPKFLRWFRYGSNFVSGWFLASEEWLDHESKTNHKFRIAVFNTLTGDEITGPLVDALKHPAELESIRSEIQSAKSSTV